MEIRLYSKCSGNIFRNMLLCLFFSLGIISSAAQVADKPVWQQTKPDGNYYLKGRHALVGKGCEVNMLVNTVKIGAWTKNLGNIVDEDLSNTATFPAGVALETGVAPIVSIRDMENHYAGGTIAGFVIASSEGSLLTLDVIKAYAIQFYCDGEAVGQPVPVREGQNAGALSLSLIKIPGSNDVTSTLSAVSPGEFDEVCLMPAGGVNLSLIANTKVKYAFVGKAKQYNIVNAPNGCKPDGSDGIEAFNRDFGTDLILEVESTDTQQHEANFINDNLEDDGVNFAKVLVGGGNVKIKAMPRNYVAGSGNSDAPFKKGTVFGFHFANATDILNIGGKDIRLCLGKKKNQLNQTEDIWSDKITVSGDILKVSVSGGKSGDIEIRTNQDCYGAMLEDGGAGLGGMNIRYAYIRTPDEVNHRCDIRLSADTHICDNETSYKVTVAEGVSVTYEIIKQPAGAGAQIDAQGNITGMTANGDYVVKATAASDGKCAETLTIHRGMDDIERYADDKPLYNVSDNVYQLSTDTHGISGALINIDNISDPDNILNAQTADYAQYTGGLGLAQNVMIVGVKTTNGRPLKENMPSKQLKRVGFVVETRSESLGLDALKFFCIRGFRNGQEVFNKPVEESNAVSLGIIGNSRAVKMRYSVAVTDDTADIDEFQLWKEGVLNITISRLNIFYAFAAEDDTPDAPFAGVKAVSSTTGASLNADRMADVAVASVAGVTYQLTNLIDYDPDFNTPLTIANTLSAGGSVYSVRLGRTYKKSTQVGFVIDNKTYTASAGIGNWMKIRTYLNGKEQEVQTDWNVLGLSVIGAGDKKLMIMGTSKDFDEVSIEISQVLAALDYIKVYGVFVRDDADGDGVPDVLDEESCSEDLILNEENTAGLAKGRNYTKARLLLHRTFNRGENIGDNQWSSIVLPVSLTGLQVRNAFGNNTRLAEVEGMEEDLLVFKRIDVPANDDNPVIKPGVFYIIETVRTPDYTKATDDNWNTFDDNTPYNSGDVYYISGVNYNTADETEPSAEFRNKTATHNVTFKGTYCYKQQLPEDIYAFNGGKLWNIKNSAKMKGFRFWIEETFGETEAKPISFKVTDGNGCTTYLSDTTSDSEPQYGMVHNLNGQNVGTVHNLFDVSSGIYIINGKKIIVK